MNKKITSLLCAIITVMLLVNIGTFQVYAVTTGGVYVDPPSVVFSTVPGEPNYAEVGDTFDVNVTAADFIAPGLFAYAFKIHYDPAILNVSSFSRPANHFFAPDFTPVSNADPTAGWLEIGASLLGAAPGKTGSGVLATVTFKIIKAPPPAGAVSCILEIEDTGFLDYDLDPCTLTIQNGYYEFSPPRPSVYLSVDPPIVGALNVGDDVSVDIMINDVEKEIKLVGLQWKLHYNTTLLSVLNVTEGDFFKDWAVAAGVDPETIYFWWLQEEDYVISFTIYAEFEIAPPTVFPSGSGTLATVTFTATYKPETGRATCDLVLDKEFVMLIDVDENIIPYHHLENGRYEIPVKLGDLNFDGKIDIFDIGIFAKAYGSYPGHPRWNPLADVVRNRVINILDLVRIAKNFGK